MSFIVKPAQPIDNRLLIALAGPQASGKTTSALRLATGITQVTGGKICLIDTENKRALRYATDFQFNHMPFDPPFSPARYLEAVEAATKQGYANEGDVIILDSMSHEHEGPGGVLEMHEDFLEKKCGQDYNKREKLKFTAWIKPKGDRTRCIQMGLQRCRAHVILCFRAKEKVKMEKNAQGKIEVINDGWQPIGGDEYFFEMDITMMLPLGAKGKPDWSEKASRINEYDPNGPINTLLHATQQISEATGKGLAQSSMVKKPGGGAATGAQTTAPGRTEPVKTETVEQKTKRVAGEIVTKIKACEDTTDLHNVMEDHRDVLDEIKTASQAAHDYVIKEYDQRRLALGG